MGPSQKERILFQPSFLRGYDFHGRGYDFHGRGYDSHGRGV